MFTIRKLLSPREGVPTNMRFVPGVGIQVTPDEGETWNNDPASDPRGNPAYVLPSAEFDECSIAAGMVEGLQQFVIQMITTTSVGQLATASTALLGNYLPALAWAYPLSTDVAEQTMTLGQVAIDEAMTLPVYEDLKCIFYCNLPSTKILTEEAWTGVIADVNSQIGDAVVTGVLSIWHELLGVIGITNAGLLNNDAEANCDGCDCGWCYKFDFELTDGGWTAIPINPGVTAFWDDGIGWSGGVTQEDGCSGHQYNYIRFELPASASNIDSADITLSDPYAYDGTKAAADLYFGGDLADRQFFAPGEGTVGYNVGFTGGATATALGLIFGRCGANNSQRTVWVNVTYRGRGENPFGESNCDE